MSQKTHAQRLADWLDGSQLWPSYVPQEAAAELRRMHTENETLRHKLQTLDELGAAGDDVQLLRMGYAAARLEIESLQAQAQQCGAGAGCCAQAARIEELEAQLEAVGADPDDEAVPANASESYTQRVIEALYENGDPVSVDAAEELRRLTAQLEAVTTGETLCRLGLVAGARPDPTTSRCRRHGRLI